MAYSWVVRTPYTNAISQTWQDARSYFSMHAKLMGIDVKWYKAKGRMDSGTRYHFWEIADPDDACVFYLALGDHIKQNGVRKK